MFYDGNCGLCNRVVQFLLNNEKNSTLYFAAIESSFSRDFFHKNGVYEFDLNTFYFYENGVFHKRSRAIIQLSKFLKFPFNLLRVFLIVPPFIRDAVYRFIAKRRRKIGGDFCVLIGENEIKRFLN